MLEPRKFRRPPPWKIVGILLFGLSLIVGFAFLQVRRYADRRWAWMQETTRALLQEDLDYSGARPPLRGPGEAGNAWDDYELGFPGEDVILHHDQELFLGFLESGAKLEHVQALISSHASVLDHLRRGVNRKQSKFQFRTEAGGFSKQYSMEGPRWVGYLGMCDSVLLSAQGRSREAAERALDVLQYSRDLLSSSPAPFAMPSGELFDISIGILQDVVISQGLTQADLVEIGRELETLEGRFFRRDVVVPRGAMNLGFNLLSLDGVIPTLFTDLYRKDPRSPLKSWRYAFSSRLMDVSAFEAELGYERGISEAEGASWPEYQRRVIDLHDRLKANPNPLITLPAPPIDGMERASLTRVRLLRMGVHFKTTGQVLSLADPFGGRLRHQVGGSHFKAWSVGKSGVDNGGVGDFRERGIDCILIELNH